MYKRMVSNFMRTFHYYITVFNMAINYTLSMLYKSAYNIPFTRVIAGKAHSQSPILKT